MENKYYAPTIDEFYEGFEFELGLETTEFKVRVSEEGYPVRCSDKQTTTRWIPKKYEVSYFTEINYIDADTITAMNTLEHYLIENKIRVKYLDEQDIKSLGFIRIGRGGDMIKFMKDDLEVNFHLDANINENVNVTIYRITDLIFMDFRECLRLTIKNKSELKLLLKQLNIL